MDRFGADCVLKAEVGETARDVDLYVELGVVATVQIHNLAKIHSHLLVR